MQNSSELWTLRSPAGLETAPRGRGSRRVWYPKNGQLSYEVTYKIANEITNEMTNYL